MIYVETSVVLAWILAEDRRPDASLWREDLVTSRLTEYEIANRLNAYGATPDRERAARDALSRLSFPELVRPVLERAIRPFPAPVRTLDALHLSTLAFLAARSRDVALASYDARMLTAAEAMGVPAHPLP